MVYGATTIKSQDDTPRITIESFIEKLCHLTRTLTTEAHELDNVEDRHMLLILTKLAKRMQ